MTLEFLKKRKLLSSMIIISFISFLVGILFISVLGNDNQELIKSSVNSYFNSLNDGNIDYIKVFYSTISSNLLLCIFIWIMGISIVGVFFVVGVLIFKCFLAGFSFASILFTYGFKGGILGIIYMFGEVFKLFILFVLCYYSISFSFMLFNYLFRKKDISRKIVVSRYLKVFLIVICFLIVISLIEVFVIPSILKIF